MTKTNLSKIFYWFGDKNLSLSSLKNNEKIQLGRFAIYTNRIILAEQTHSNLVRIVQKNNVGAGIDSKEIPFADALITDKNNIFLAVKSADCVPIFMFDQVKKIIAAVHSGREGTRKNIISNTLKSMIIDFHCQPKNIFVKLGPAICEQCYSVDEITFNNFVDSTEINQKFPFLDIKKVLLKQISEFDIPNKNIENIKICTFENENYYSYRKNGTSERQISLIGILL